jgi:ABC-type dipeptide/oligopeptide/nickel transport system ATPase subunit
VFPLLEVRNLTVEFATALGNVTAVRDVSFQIAPGEVLGLVGESGSGKSVSALAILRLLPPQARIHGNVQFRGEDLLAAPEPQMRHIRGAGISMIFQEPMTALNPVMRVGDQIAEAVLAHANSGASGAKAPKQIGPVSAQLKLRPFKDSSGAKAPTDLEWRDADLIHPNPRNTGAAWGPRLAARSTQTPGSRAKVTKAEAWRLAVEALRTVAIADPDRRRALRLGSVPDYTTLYRFLRQLDEAAVHLHAEQSKFPNSALERGRLQPCTSRSRKVTNSSRWTTPCSTLVRPLAKVRMLRPRVNSKSNKLACSTPSTIGWPVKLLTASMAGMVSPMVDSTDQKR